MQYTISEFAKKLNISSDTLRYYEKEGLLHPSRAQNNHRTYSEQDFRWMETILRLKETNMPITQIKKYTQLYNLGNATILERKEMLEAHQKTLKATLLKWQNHHKKLQEKIKIYDHMYNQIKHN